MPRRIKEKDKKMTIEFFDTLLSDSYEALRAIGKRPATEEVLQGVYVTIGGNINKERRRHDR